MRELTIVWNFLKGKKTFVIATGAAVYAVGIKYNVWSHQIWLDLLFGAASSASIRHGISNTNDPASIVETLEQPTAKLASPKDTN